MVEAVTSFSPEGFALYGRTFLKSFLRYTDLPIVVYIEARQPKLPKSKRIQYRDLWAVPGCAEFVRSAAPTPRNYRTDATRFCRKVFAQLDAMDDPVDALFWFDADIEMQGRLTATECRKHVKDVAVAYMGREGFHLCSSFVGYNLKHPDLKTYKERMRALYLKKQIYKLTQGYTDCDAMESAMIGLEVRNICGGNSKAVGTANVFDMCFPGHHKKGNRKFKQ